ncbi:putative amine oxidase [Fusarium solani]|uniref:Amine oxidase n=1 Tax=Fusarium solani TaxID=169388 RepID=A0A9P9JMN1_FUSSL|nr:putative amine oxidase [Fusarium solani]KAH7230383.1 putative amine oxidase [Fusarium solani]
MTAYEVDVVVIGAGLSGLSAAKAIQSANLSCAVLEAMDRVGGRVYSVPTSSHGAPVDLGAAWISNTSQPLAFNLAKKYGLELKEQRGTGSDLFQSRDGTVISSPHGQGGLPEKHLEGLGQFFSSIEEMVAQVDPQKPYEAKNASVLDSQTLLDLAEKQPDPYAAAIAARLIAESSFGVEANAVSVLYLADYARKAGSLSALMSDTEGGAQHLRIRQGCQALAVGLSKELLPGTVRLSCPVSKLAQVSPSRCEVVTANQLVFRCKKVILSVPFANYGSIQFEPVLEPRKQHLINNSTIGYYSKVILVFGHPWWAEAGLSGNAFSENGPVRYTFDTSFEDDGQFSLTCFLTGGSGALWSLLTPAERRVRVIRHVQSLFASSVGQVPEPIRVIEMEWTKNPWVRGGPNALLGPGSIVSDFYRALRLPDGNIHFVGSETSLTWRGFMEGALSSGERGAQEVIMLLSGNPSFRL